MEATSWEAAPSCSYVHTMVCSGPASVQPRICPCGGSTKPLGARARCAQGPALVSVMLRPGCPCRCTAIHDLQTAPCPRRPIARGEKRACMQTATASRRQQAELRTVSRRKSRPASRGPRCAHPHQRHCSGLALLAALDSSQNRRTTDLISLRRDALAQLGPSFFGSCAARTSSSLCIPHDDPVRPGARIHGVQCP